MKLTGRAHKYGANVDTDVIIPARYLNMSDPKDLAKHCMEDIDSGFIKKANEGDFIVATANFGCGSSREHAPLAIKAAGVSCVIASSFARIFYRNAINIGLPILECSDGAEAIKSGDELEVDLSAGTVVNRTTGESYQSKPYPEFMLELVDAGGLVEYTRKKLGIAS